MLVAALGHDIGHPGVNNGCSTAEREASEANVSKQKRVTGVGVVLLVPACLGGRHNSRVRKESNMYLTPFFLTFTLYLNTFF